MWKLALIALVVPWIAFGFTSCHLWHYSCYLLKYHSKPLLTIQPYSILHVIRISNVDFRVAKYMCFIIVFFFELACWFGWKWSCENWSRDTVVPIHMSVFQNVWLLCGSLCSHDKHYSDFTDCSMKLRFGYLYDTFCSII